MWFFLLSENNYLVCGLFLLSGNNSLVCGLLYICMVFAFLLRLPMFIVHLWLPKVHVEAPVSGSTILGGVLLKLDVYGLLRVFLVLFKFEFRFSVVWVALNLTGGFLLVYFVYDRLIWSH